MSLFQGYYCHLLLCTCKFRENGMQRGMGETGVGPSLPQYSLQNGMHGCL